MMRHRVIARPEWTALGGMTATMPAPSRWVRSSMVSSNSPSSTCATCSWGWECSGSSAPAAMVQVTEVIVTPFANRPTKPGIGSLRAMSVGERNATAQSLSPKVKTTLPAAMVTYCCPSTA